MNKYWCFFAVYLAFLSCKTLPANVEAKSESKPNIVWIMLEDWGLQLSCYDEPGIATPFIDKLALEGRRYNFAYATAPVCSPSRSAMMTGFYQNFIGANQHRTSEKFGFPKRELPTGIEPITYHLKRAGYYTALMYSTKTDLNFIHGGLFDSKDWADRAEGQPFFAQITLTDTHRIWKRDSISPIDIKDVRIPPYYPQTDFAKRDWANGLEAMQNVDRQVGEIIDRLEREGVLDNTVVFLIGDNGRCMPRGKQFLYEGGVQVPLIIRWPEKIKKGEISNDLVSTLDITKTILDLSGSISEVPLQGMNLLSGETANREYVFVSRDKMDSTYDAMRAVRSKKHKLIHNLMPERPYLQYNQYKEQNYPVLAQLNVMFLKGQLNEDQLPFMASEKPEFELFDLENDPYELHNLAYDPDYVEIKEKLLNVLNDWRVGINDQGVTEEFRTGGWPATFPTRSLEEWEQIQNTFSEWIFREPTSKMKHPKISR